MSKYEPLGQFLSKLDAQHWRPTFHELERLLEFELPASARRRVDWWANEARSAQSQASAWLDAGWTVEKADLAKGVVSFVKRAGPPAAEAAEAAVSGAARMADEAKLRAQAAKDWAAERTDQAAEMVRARPGVVLGAGAGLAFVAGVALGLLLIPRRPSAAEQAYDVAEDRATDLFHMLKDRLAGLHIPDRASDYAHSQADHAQSKADDALAALKKGLKELNIPDRAAEIAREKADEAMHLLRETLKDLRSAAKDKFGR